MSEKKQPQNPPRQEEEAIQFGDELPVLPIRNAVLFPGAVAPFDVGREKSVALVEDVDNLTSPVIAIFAQRVPPTDDPGADDLHTSGCVALESVTQTGQCLKANIKRLDEGGCTED